MLVVPQLGLRAEYFQGPDRTGTPAIVSLDAEPSTQQVIARWLGSAPDVFSVQWLGYLTVTRAGDYVFALSSDDQSWLTVDGEMIIRNDRPATAQSQAQSVHLDAGAHAISVELLQQGGRYEVNWQWVTPGGVLDAVPRWALTPAKPRAWRVVAAHWMNLGSLGFLLLAAIAGVANLRRWRSMAVRHPRAATFALFAALAVVHTWPLATSPAHLTRHDNRDTILNQWILAWVAHEAPRAPLHLFDANIFYPERDTLAYSEAMLVQSAMGAPMMWAGASPVLTYNILLLAGFALTGWTMCLVVQRWTSDWTAGLIAGSVFGVNAHTLTRMPHLQAQHVEFLPIALLALDSLLRQPSARRGLRLAFWSVLQALTSVYLLVFTLLALVVAMLVRPRDWIGARFGGVARALGVATLVAGALLVPFLLPYYRVSHDQGLTRTLNDAAQYSASWRDYLTTPARVHAWWSRPVFAHAGATTGLFPGAIGFALALLALVRGIGLRDSRARMALAIGVAGFCLSFGPALPGYGILYSLVPLLQAVRATARFGYLVTFAVAVLAGFGMMSLRRSCSVRTWAWLAPALVVATALEPMAAPLSLGRFEGIAPIYSRVPTGPGVVVVEIPFFGSRSAQFHAHYMLNSTKNWQPLVNGYSGFQPASFYQHAEVLQRFPDDSALRMLREIGVTHVFVHRGQLDAAHLAALDARHDLERIDVFGDTELYRLR